MMKIIKLMLGALCGLVVLAVIGVWGYLNFSGDDAHFAGVCETLGLGDESAEDIQVDRDRGFAYLSLISRAALARGEDAQGWIGRVDLNADPMTVEPALIDPPPHLRPHGLSLHIDAQGQRTLALINHPVNRGSDPEQVELFIEEEPGRFRHLRSFTDPLISRPNDLVAVGPEQYYIANDSPPNSGQTTNLVYVDQDQARTVTDDIRSGGGINVSPEGDLVYVAETGGKAIRVLQRNPADGSVTTIDTVEIGTSPDNIDVAEDGSLWIGAHADLTKLVFHFILGTNAPSQVLRVDLNDAAGPVIDEIYLNRGEEISTSSVGVTYGNKLLIGSITAPQMLVCEMTQS